MEFGANTECHTHPHRDQEPTHTLCCCRCNSVGDSDDMLAQTNTKHFAAIPCLTRFLSARHPPCHQHRCRRHPSRQTHLVHHSPRP